MYCTRFRNAGWVGTRSPLFMLSRFVKGWSVIALLLVNAPLLAAQLEVPATYATIQAAVNASVAGDTINIAAGTYVEQVTVNKAVTLQGAGTASTIIQAPAHASLVATAVPSLKGTAAPRYAVLDLETATAGSGTVTVKNLTIDGNYEGFAQTVKVGTSTTYFIGIATFNTNAVIDNVAIKHMAAGPFDGSFSENGWGIGFGIMAEGGATLPAGGNPVGGSTAPNVTVTIRNSTIDTFQKAGIIAWGPKLNAVITNNHISGSGIYGTSGQNGIQIGSGGDRTNTTATISGNTIDKLGAPNNLVMSGQGATGILPVTAGVIEAHHNTITLDTGASANSLIGIDVNYTSAAANLHDNTLNGMSSGIQVTAPLNTAVHTIVNNTLSTSGGNPVVFYYDPAGNGDTGGETIANFGAGYAIRVVGENFTSGAATLGNGSSMAANSIQMAASGGNTILYVDSSVANGSATAPLQITLNGVYQLANFVLSGEYIRFRATYSVTYNGNGNTGGTVPTDGSSPYISGTNVTLLRNTGALVKTGNTFNGWNTAANGYGTAYAEGATLTAIAANTTLYAQWTPDPLVLPTVPGINGQPTVMDMRAGNAPVIANCVADTMRQALGGTVNYLGQNASGATQIGWNDQIISFYPLSSHTTDARTYGIHTQSINPADVVSSCGTLNVTPAVYNLSELGVTLAGLGLSAQINQQGVITVNLNGTIYVVRPDFLVTTDVPGAPLLFMGQDGLYRFRDSKGYTQVMRPAFLDPAALQNVLTSTFGASMTVQLDGTVLVSQAGSLFILTADQTLTPVGADHASDSWWSSGTPPRYHYRVMTTPFTLFGQGLSLVPKVQ